jgi:3-oxoacyl-[acyl-carrier protein] reductase
MAELAQRVAVVTGAASGIGRATAVLLAEQGAAVGVLDTNADGAQEVASGLTSRGLRALAVRCNVADERSVGDAISAVTAAFGGVDILVNNAGVAGNNARLEDIDRAAYDRMFDVHVRGALHCVQAVLPSMRQRPGGRIVNISSNRGQVGFERSSHYSAAKAALLGFTKSWARELAPAGITVNAIAPGVVRSAMTLSYGEAAVAEEAQLNLLKRWAEPEEIAHAVLYLVGKSGAFMTGQVLCPNGGDPIVGI